MKQQYIIDGYNLMHKFGDLKSRIHHDLEGARDGLLMRLSRYARHTRAEFVVVFDGDRSHLSVKQKKAGISIHFSSRGQTADDLIKRLLDRSGKSRDVIVVSSDREVSNYARMNGRKYLGAGAFIRQMTPISTVTVEDKQERVLAPSEVEEWMRLFTASRNED